MELNQARRIIGKLHLALYRGGRRWQFPGGSPAVAAEMLLVLRVLVVAETPLSVAAVTRRTQLSRSTTTRRLAQLSARGLILRNGRYYEVDLECLAKLFPPKRVRQTAALIIATANELTKLGGIF